MRNYETKVYDYVEKTTGARVVKAVTMYAGKTVSAFAKCDPEDTFDLEFGKKVALRRLDAKIAKKRLDSMTSYVRFCKMNLEFVENEKRRIQKALQRAEVAVTDRRAEVEKAEAEITEMLSSV